MATEVKQFFDDLKEQVEKDVGEHKEYKFEPGGDRAFSVSVAHVGGKTCRVRFIHEPDENTIKATRAVMLQAVPDFGGSAQHKPLFEVNGEEPGDIASVSRRALSRLLSEHPSDSKGDEKRPD